MTPANGVEMLDAMYAQMQQKGALRDPGRGGGGGDVCDDLWPRVRGAAVWHRRARRRRGSERLCARVAVLGEPAAVAVLGRGRRPPRRRVHRARRALQPAEQQLRALRLRAAQQLRHRRHRTAADAAEPRPWCGAAGWRRGRRRRYSAPNPLGGGGAADACSYDDCVESFMSEMFTGRHGHPGCGFERFEVVTEVTEENR